MTDVKLKQVRSANGASAKQRDTLRALKLGKIGRESALADSPQLRGMIRVVDHLVVIDPDGADAGGGATGGGGS